MSKAEKRLVSTRTLRRVCTTLWLAVIFLSPALAQVSPDKADGTALRPLLERIGKSVEVFWQQAEAVTCTELVSQAKLAGTGGVLYQTESVFDYMIIMNPEKGVFAVEESRVLQKESAKRNGPSLLVTSGFPTLLLIFHPFYQGNFEYEQLGEEILDGRKAVTIRFRHVPGTRSTSAVRLRGKDFPLDLEGTAWIDAETMAVARIQAGLMSPMKSLGLQLFKSDVRYALSQFPSAAYWLPVTASIDLETGQQHWRNLHRFTNYRQFSVKSETTVSR